MSGWWVDGRAGGGAGKCCRPFWDTQFPTGRVLLTSLVGPCFFVVGVELVLFDGV